MHAKRMLACATVIEIWLESFLDTPIVNVATCIGSNIIALTCALIKYDTTMINFIENRCFDNARQNVNIETVQHRN